MQNQSNVIYKIPFNSGKIRYNKKILKYFTEKRSYFSHILHPYKKIGLSEVVLGKEKVSVSKKQIKNIVIYRCVNIGYNRKNVCLSYFVIDALFKRNLNKSKYYSEEPYLRIYIDKQVEKKEILQIIGILLKEDF